MSTVTVSMLGAEYALGKPKGRKGMRLMSSVQGAHRKLIKKLAENGAIEEIETLSPVISGSKDVKMTGELAATLLSIQGIQDDVVLTDEFLDEAVVPLMMASGKGLTKKQANTRIDEYTFRPGTAEELFGALQAAIQFWEEEVDDPEALDEAVKK